MKVVIGDLTWTSYTKLVRGEKVTKWRVKDMRTKDCTHIRVHTRS